MFYSDTFPQIIQSLWLSKGKMPSGFAIGYPGQRRVPLLIENKVVVCDVYTCILFHANIVYRSIKV
jgi:hypothetical protein